MIFVSHSDCSSNLSTDTDVHGGGNEQRLPSLDHRISFLVPSSAQSILQEVDESFDLGRVFLVNRRFFSSERVQRTDQGLDQKKNLLFKENPCQLLFLAQEAKQLN